MTFLSNIKPLPKFVAVCLLVASPSGSGASHAKAAESSDAEQLLAALLSEKTPSSSMLRQLDALLMSGGTSVEFQTRLLASPHPDPRNKALQALKGRVAATSSTHQAILKMIDTRVPRWPETTAAAASALKATADNPSDVADELMGIVSRQSDVVVQSQAVETLWYFGPQAQHVASDLLGLLSSADGSTSDRFVGALLDAIGASASTDRVIAQALAGLLPERSKLYADRDKLEVQRLRAHLLVTLAAFEMPTEATPYIVDPIVNADRSMPAVVPGSACRAAGAMGTSAEWLVPHLLQILTLDFRDNDFCLDRYRASDPGCARTCVELEVINAMGRIRPRHGAAVSTRLQQLVQQSRFPDDFRTRIFSELERVRNELDSNDAE